MKKNTLSHSQVRLYTDCARRYKLHYVDRIRPSTTSGALLFGSALDNAINELLTTKDYDKAASYFDKCFQYNTINNISQYIPTSENVVYAATDFDGELLKEEDRKKFNDHFYKLNGFINELALEDRIDNIVEAKGNIGWENLSKEHKQLYNLGNWLSLKRKGHIMLKAYQDDIVPQIKEVLAIQKRINIENNAGDTITGIIDLIVEWKDGKRYVLDNKTSTRDYEADAAARSQQLIVYYHSEKEELKLDGVGFIVLYKQIQKNRTKICSVCKYDGSGKRHKLCDNLIGGDRCNGAWTETIDPQCRIEVILSGVSEIAEDLVLETFDQANRGIKNEDFSPNLDACKKGGLICPYIDYCWRGKMDGLTNLGEKE